MPRSRLIFPAVWSAFFLSGSAGLIYEVVWARYLDLILGGTAYAHVMVLTAYMGGMALGARVIGRLTDRVREPLALYAYLEMGIGMYGLAFPLIFSGGSALYLILAGVLGTTGAGGIVNKFLVSALLLVPSTFCMGGTLPLLTRVLTTEPDRVGGRVAGLYFINSFGAVLGALLAGFLFIPAVGMSATLTIAAILNVVAGIGLLGLWRYGWLTGERGRMSAGKHPVAEAAQAAEPRRWEFDGFPSAELRSPARIALWGAGLSGLTVMMYEVAWIRMLSTILGSSTYSFTLMLAAFISGIALGSLLARRLARMARPFLLFGLSQLAIGASLLLTLPLYGRLPFTFLWLQSVVAPTEAGYPVHELLKYLFCLVIMVPPTLASGAALPLATDTSARLQRGVGGPVGRVYAVNTVGTIAGALLGGLVLLPLIGVKLTLELGIAVNLAVGFIALSSHPRFGRRALRATAIGVGAAVLTYLAAAPGWDLRAFANGVFRERLHGPDARAVFAEKIEQAEVLFYAEDINGTVAVMRNEAGTSLIVNGKADASTSPGDRTTQTMLATIPALMVEQPRRAFVIGLGSGQTVGHLLRYPFDRVEVVEISPGVVRASRYFDDMNGRPLEDERTELVTRDARTYLLTRPEARFDVIISEPSNPWIAGIGGLFSVEYFATLKERLEPGGVAAQWIHVYEQSDETLNCVFLTFAQVFPYVSVWGMSPGDLLLLGSTEPQTWDFSRTAERFARSGVNEDLAAIGVTDLYTLLSRQVMSPLRFAEAVSLGGRINSNVFPYLEYRAPRAFFVDARTTLHLGYDERVRTVRNTDLAIGDYLAGRDPTRAEKAAAARYFALRGGLDPRLRIAASAAWLESAPGDPAAVREGIASGVTARLAALETSAELLASDGSDDALREHIDLLIDSYTLMRSTLWPADRLASELARLLPQAANRFPEEAYYYLYRYGLIEYDRGEYAGALELLSASLDELRDRTPPPGGLRIPPSHILTWQGKVQMILKDYQDAQTSFRVAWLLEPGNTVAAFWANELNPGMTSGRFLPPAEIIPR